MKNPSRRKLIRQANLLLLIEEAGGAVELAALLKSTPPSHLSAMKSGARGVGDALAARLEKAMDKTAGWMDEQHSPEGPGDPSLAQAMSHPTAIVLPQLVTREGLVAMELPASFRLVLRDEAMAPDLRAGAAVIFSTEESPRPGDAVLVRDADGNFHCREYRERRPGHWQAVPLNPAFLPALDPVSDGVAVVAVMVGLWGRRG